MRTTRPAVAVDAVVATAGRDRESGTAARAPAGPMAVARRALHAEWTKLVTVPAQLWLAAAVTGLTAAVGLLVAVTQHAPNCPAGTPCSAPDSTALALSGVYVAQLAAIMLGVALVASEYQPRVIRLTLAACPRRGAVFAAKCAVGTAAVLAAGAAGVAAALLAGGAVLRARGLHTVSYGDPALQRAAVGTLLYLLLVSLLAAGLAWALRHQAAAAGGTAALLFGPYLVARIVPMPPHTLHVVLDMSPMTAGLAVQSAVAGAGTAPLAPWTGLGVLAVYAAVSLALGRVLLERRDG
jgi:ABC-2 type transport system permease protein